MLDPKSSANKLIFKDSNNNTNNTNNTKLEVERTTPSTSANLVTPTT
jgi:hypothetical protein